MGVPATSSNCGKSLKLSLPSGRSKGPRGQGNDRGYGNNVKDATMGDPQPSPTPETSRVGPGRDAVQRLNGDGSRLEHSVPRPGLRYSLLPTGNGRVLMLLR
jgi:hypothetical protein